MSYLITMEIICRIIVDPVYFYRLNTYNYKLTDASKLEKIRESYLGGKTNHVDLLFIGSSRVPATINKEIVEKLYPHKIAIVAGRGYMTSGVNYHAITNKIRESPDYLKNAVVLLEYPGGAVYDENFLRERYKVFELSEPDEVAMPHLLLPHLKYKSFIQFLRNSPNSFRVKNEMVFLYFSSFYRSRSFVREIYKSLESPFIEKEEKRLVAEGGIRNEGISEARDLALFYAEQADMDLERSPNLTMEDLDQSCIAYLNRLIVNNGGRLILYKMPLHSIQDKISYTDNGVKNRNVFDKWLSKNKIRVINLKEFEYSDGDFPDMWHLSIERRDEFTVKLCEELRNNLSGTNQ